jgi:hypothetical protein
MIETLRYEVMNVYSLSVCREVKNGLYRKVLQSISHSQKKKGTMSQSPQDEGIGETLRYSRNTLSKALF